MKRHQPLEFGMRDSEVEIRVGLRPDSIELDSLENRKSKIENRKSKAFTLIELILVMALLLIVAGVTFPSLRNFFQGRSLDSEARRFLSLTRYAQSRAISEGMPMVLWLDAREGTYGLQAETGYVDSDNK